MNLTPQQRVTRALLGQPVDRIPFTAYENKLSWGRAERELRNDGLCIVYRRTSFYSTTTPKCVRTTREMQRDGQTEVHTQIETPAGILTSVHIDRGEALPWHMKYLFASPDDYAPLEAYLRDMQFAPNYDAVRQKEQEGGGDFFVRGGLGYSPLHDLMLMYMGLERFSYEWADRRPKVLELYEVLWEKRRALYPLAVAAPLLAFNICGNVTASVVSPKMFRDYYLPCYVETAEALHCGGKLVGVHMDGLTRPYAADLRESPLDYIEALTPPPDCDVSVAEAHQFWPDKILWMNFPSSVHLESLERIRQVTRQLLAEARSHRRFLLAITEAVPPDRWADNFRAILDEVNRHTV